jgi:hypothetical protein
MGAMGEMVAEVVGAVLVGLVIPRLLHQAKVIVEAEVRQMAVVVVAVVLRLRDKLGQLR